MTSTYEILILVLGTLTPFTLIGYIFYLYFRARNRERLLLIEKGIDPSFRNQKGRRANFSVFRYGLLFTSIGAGILIGHLISVVTPFKGMSLFISMILLFGGGSLILSYFLEQKYLESIDSKEK